MDKFTLISSFVGLFILYLVVELIRTVASNLMFNRKLKRESRLEREEELKHLVKIRKL